MISGGRSAWARAAAGTARAAAVNPMSVRRSRPDETVADMVRNPPLSEPCRPRRQEPHAPVRLCLETGEGCRAGAGPSLKTEPSISAQQLEASKEVVPGRGLLGPAHGRRDATGTGALAVPQLEPE